jgi:adenine-specific DNA-methyltransferase
MPIKDYHEQQFFNALRKADREEVSDETLEKAFRVFEKQAEVDYFINKNARAFLEEQFDLWMYQYLFEGQDVWSAERLAQLQALKRIAFKVKRITVAGSTLSDAG